MQKSLALKSLAAAGLLLVLWPMAVAAADPRRPNDFESAYTALALDTLSHELCGKISPEAQSRSLFNSRGSGPPLHRHITFLRFSHICEEIGYGARRKDGSGNGCGPGDR